MEELINRIVSSVGIDEGLANKAVSIILNFLNKDGPSDGVSQLLEAIPGASEFISNASDSGGGGGLMGGLSSLMGDVGGGGAMAAVSELTAAGLDMGQVQGVTTEVIGFAKEKAGDELVNSVLGQIPGLDQFL